MSTDEELEVADAIAALGRINPFLAERRTWERRALGHAFVPAPEVWSLGEEGGDNPNLARLAEVAEQTYDRLRRRFERYPATPRERELHAQLVFYVLYNRHAPGLPLVMPDEEPAPVAAAYARFLGDFRDAFRLCGPVDVEVDTAPHLFACFYQIKRAIDVIFSTIIGGSPPAAALRAATWQSVFSFDAVRYRRFLFRTMADIPTLITGPTGTGKELVARAIGLSGYIPFDPDRGRFQHAPTFLPLNLSAMPSALIESELFGHRKGAFTGAVADREGWLSICPRGGTVFLDEIGELEPMLQVKLLRVLEDRSFTAVGDSKPRPFLGKIVAATNRDLPAAIHAGTFRGDLYYRLCGDRIETPTLRERLDADPAELDRVLAALVGRSVPMEFVAAVTAEVSAEIRRARGAEWPWPGNVRELAQCARNVLVRGSCGPAEASSGAADGSFSALEGGQLSLAEVSQRYVAHVYERVGSYKAAAQLLGIDWRTVKAHVDAVGGD